MQNFWPSSGFDQLRRNARGWLIPTNNYLRLFLQRWHVGLDVHASALLNDLYEDKPVEPERLQRLLSLFRLEFDQPQEMRADVAGKPVYLGLMMSEDRAMRLKPQNLLLNLPLASLA